MSRSELKALVVLEMLSDAVAAIDAGSAPDGVVCARLAAALGASAGVVVDVRPDGGSKVSSIWPDPEAAGALAAYVTHATQVPTAGVTVIEVRRIGGEEWSVLLGAVRPAGANTDAGRAWLVAFARAEPFGRDDVRLWECAQRPLSVLWTHVECQARSVAVPPSGAAVVEPETDAHGMSQRERQVLALLAQGMLARAIAHQLSLSPRTVHKHLGNIYRKLGVNDRLVAVTMAQRYGLIDLRLGASAVERSAARPA